MRCAAEKTSPPTPDPAALIETIRASVIGDDEAVEGPFGLRRVTYADYTASGRSAHVHRGLHPRRGPAALREHPHRVIGHRPPDDALPRGRPARSSATPSAARRRARRHLLRLGLARRDQQARRRPRPALPADLDDRYGLRAAHPADERPVVFIGPYEHHSNELPWRESIADVVDDPRGRRRPHRPRAPRARARRARRPAAEIGSFSAASNVTGILSDTRAISVLLHRHGALSFWDFAAAAPVRRDRDGRADRPGGDRPTRLDYKDAIFLSPHKFIGGPGTPGVLVARRELFRNRVPTCPAAARSPTSTRSSTST